MANTLRSHENKLTAQAQTMSKRPNLTKRPNVTNVIYENPIHLLMFEECLMLV